MAYARSSPIGFHHPFVVDLDLDLGLDLGHLARAYAAEQRRQEWEYAQHVMHLRRQQQQEQERAHARKLRAAAEEQEELRRRRRHQQQVVEALAAAELDRRRRQQQAEFQLYLQQQQQQQQQRARQVQRQQRRRLQAQRGAAAAATATAAGRRRPLSHVLGSLVPSAVDQLYYDGGLHLRDDRVSPDEDEEAAVAQSSPVEILFQLLGEQGHRQDEDDSEEEEDEEEVVLKPTQPLSLGVADPEEVDLAAAAFAADAADTADEAEQEDTAFEEEAESASESSTDDYDFEADLASADEAATPGLLEEEGAHAAHNAAAAAAALDSLAALAQDFTARRRSFVSPAALSFQPAPSATPTSTSGSTALRSPTPPLAFESNNTPFLGYEDFLVSLLSRIDAVESHGVREVRRARKNLVREVEQELARLDDLKDRAWERLSASSASPSSASEVSSDEAKDTEMTPEPVQGLTPDEPSTFDLELDLDSASDSEASGMHVKVPFSVRRSATSSSSRSPRRSRVRTGRPRRSHPREGTPALSDDASSSSSSTDNVDDEQVADILLHARRLGEQVAQLEEAERDQQKSKRQVDADADSSSESEDEDDELVLVYF